MLWCCICACLCARKHCGVRRMGHGFVKVLCCMRIHHYLVKPSFSVLLALRAQQGCVFVNDKPSAGKRHPC